MNFGEKWPNGAKEISQRYSHILNDRFKMAAKLFIQKNMEIFAGVVGLYNPLVFYRDWIYFFSCVDGGKNDLLNPYILRLD